MFRLAALRTFRVGREPPTVLAACTGVKRPCRQLSQGRDTAQSLRYTRSAWMPGRIAAGSVAGHELERVADVAARLERELAKAIVGQQRVIREILIAFLAGGHCLLRGVPGLAKTLLIKTLAQAVDLKFNRIQFTPDLMPSDIIGTEVIEEDRTTGTSRDSLHPRAGLRQHPARRRDQPHAAQDAGRAARGDAGVPGHGRRRALRSRSAVLRARDAEPDRAGGHVSAARGAARSLHVQRRDRLPERRGRAAHPRADDRQPRSADLGRRHRRGDRAAARGRPRRAGGGERHRLRRPAGARHATLAGEARASRSSSTSGCAGAPARAPARRCSSAPRPARCSRAEAWCRSTTCARWRCRCCATGCC